MYNQVGTLSMRLFLWLPQFEFKGVFPVFRLVELSARWRWWQNFYLTYDTMRDFLANHYYETSQEKIGRERKTDTFKPLTVDFFFA